MDQGERQIDRFLTHLRSERRLSQHTVDAYARTLECRSVFLRRHFGEESPPVCGTCDRCLGTEEPARKTDSPRRRRKRRKP